MAPARPAAPGFFPLDEELELLPGQLTPSVYECLTELGASISFDKARQWLQRYLRVSVSESTAQRATEKAGAAWVALETAAAERLEREAPEAPPGAAMTVVQVDGTTVPLVGGVWGEVKTVVVGTASPPEKEGDEQVVKLRDLSYFSRYTDAQTFERLALVELHRRGVENAARVAGVNDGAEWIQGFLDHHCPDALRILDFPHGAGYVSQIGQATFGADTPELAAWLQTHLHQLKHEGPDPVLSQLREMVEEHPQADALELRKALTYLEKRTAQMQYPVFQALGWPIASGAVESSHWTVVAARLQGAGMHWAPAHVDPMVALRNVICSAYWDDAWPQIERYLRQQAQRARTARREKRRAAAAPPPPATPKPCGPCEQKRASARTRRKGPWKPAPDHPWRKSYKHIPSKH